MSGEKDFLIEEGVLCRYCGSDGNVEIPEGVTEIGGRAFEHCSTLVSVTIPAGVTAIGDWAFSDCTALRSVTAPAGVKTVGWYAFAQCEQLTAVTFREGLTRIGNNAFSCCSRLESVMIPKSVTQIGKEAFYRCEKLRIITLPEGLTQIEDGTFYRCKNLETITIPESVTKIGTGGFSGCEKLRPMTIPPGVTEIGTGAFFCCKAMADPMGLVIVRDTVYHYYGKERQLTLPEQICRVERGAFEDGEALAVLTLPGRISFIGMGAFPDLCAIVAPKTPFRLFKDVGAELKATLGYLHSEEAFQRDENADRYEKSAIAQKRKLLPRILEEDMAQGLAFYARVGAINAENFEWEYLKPAMNAGATGCVAFLLDWKSKHISPEDEWQQLWGSDETVSEEELRKLWSYQELPDGTLMITRYKGTEKDLKIPARIGGIQVTVIDDEVFSPMRKRNGIFFQYKIDQIISVQIPDTVKVIRYKAFCSCSDLRSVTVPGSVERIGLYAFHNCRNLTLRVQAESFAEAYAKKHNIPYVVE